MKSQVSINDIDAAIAERVKEFDQDLVRSHRHLQQELLRQGQLDAEERAAFLDHNLGPVSRPSDNEIFVTGDEHAGVSQKSLWFASRRVHYASLLSVAVGDLVLDQQVRGYCIDLNCTLQRSFRITVRSILETDAFLVALAQYTSFKIVPTIEQAAAERRRIEEVEAMRILDSEQRQARLEEIAHAQVSLLQTLVAIEASPKVSFGILF